MTSLPTASTDAHTVDVIIIGSGPAGYTAALYTARANLQPLVFEGQQFGGALMNTTEVENFPGFADGIMGPELMDNMRKQAERSAPSSSADDVTEVDLTSNPKVVKVGDEVYLRPGRDRRDRLAAGASSACPARSTLLGHGVSRCATCDGFFFRDQDIAVVGGGDSAIEEATFLTRFARVGHGRPPPRRPAGQQDHAGPRLRQRQDPLRLEQRSRPTSSATTRSRA